MRSERTGIAFAALVWVVLPLVGVFAVSWHDDGITRAVGNTGLLAVGFLGVGVLLALGAGLLILFGHVAERRDRRKWSP